MKALKKGARVLPQESGLLDDLEEASYHGLHSYKELNSVNILKGTGRWSGALQSLDSWPAERER